MRWLPGVGFVLALLSGVVGFLWWSGEDSQSTSGVLLQTASDCRLDQESCQVDSGTVRLILSLSPRPIPVMKTIWVDAELTGLTAVQSMDIRVTGVNMYMGEQSARLQPVNEQSSRWAGSFMLPLCTSEVMLWQADVQITTTDNHYQATLPFQTRSR